MTTNHKELAVVRAFAETLERHEAKDNKCTECGQQIGRSEAWWSFKSEAIKTGHAPYEELSEFMQGFSIGDNFLYEQVVDALAHFEEYLEADPDAELGDIEPAEYIDGQVPVYTSELTAWLTESNYHPSYLEMAVKEFGASDWSGVLTGAYYEAVQEIVYALRDKCADMAESNALELELVESEAV